ncbi:S8 family serine peptidase [Pseudoalteromonas sp. McH1-7]|uniref:S8 family peptidase n=1 Tax=unclassified Pseudoalteromonas TaxID=194690 RepID=UPI000FFF5DA1|nr:MULTISPECIES: S8 family peptidase [unclassified Pseudoalteromonas]NUZ11875.1 S8 family serine peptidase [Pseudoalteromonas sp. McH1-7]RXF04146.1 peptidase S8 [Pseudoalteromonas sp. PS5]USD28209.1 S8 family serine peptidase [Pseudoalteromonas sp. SCSIO 43201]
MTINKNFKRATLSVAVAALFSASAATAAPAIQNDTALAATAQKLSSQNTLGTQFIIKYKDASSQMMGLAAEDLQPTKMQQRAESFVKGFKSNKASAKAHYVRPMALSNHHVMRADKKLSAKEAQVFMSEVMASGNVEYIEIDQMLKPFATPNDPRYSDQWHYFEAAAGINAPAAWDKATGQGVVVAVLDTGYRPHLDLDANILPGYDMISDTFVANDGGARDNDARDPGDAVTRGECGTDSTGQPVPRADQDSSWHGTHVAGTVAAVSNNGEGVAGVAYDAKVVPVRVLGKCGGLTSDIADGIIWASGGSVSGIPANANPADVINMSLGGGGACSATTQNAINQARNNGTVIVIAAGNDNDNSANYNPGNCNGVVNVASVGRDGGRAYYSNYGTNIDVAAPGGAQSFANDPEGILSTHNSGSGAPSADSYHYSQGTSMAAPHVAGVAALIKQAKPSATPDEVEAILKNTTRNFAGSCSNCGTGVVDAAAAVNEALGGDVTPPTSNVLEDGVAKTGLSGSASSSQYFTFEVPADKTNVTFTMSGGTGDADLYVKLGSQPTTASYDCRPYESGNAETCSFDAPQAGTYHVMINGYQAYSGVSLVATTSGSSTGTPQAGGGTIEDVSASSGQWVHYTIEVPEGMSDFTVKTFGGSGDADLFVKFGARPTTTSYDCRPYESGNTETCVITNPQAGTWHLSINAYRTFSGLTLDAQYKP